MAQLQTASEDLFWYWIKERHAIFLRRQRGQPKPWTADPILQRYKFTNPFRENDRGTVWLRENFLEPHHMPQNLSLLAFNICWYRMFNWWGTGEFLGWQTEWNEDRNTALLEKRMAEGKQVFTGAHIVYSRPGFGKIEAISKVCSDLFHMCVAADALITCAREEKSLQKVFNGLRTVDSVGGFMAYEMVSDMRHTRLLSDATDIMTWANPGPGAKRGLQRLQLPYQQDKDAIESMKGLLSQCPHVFALSIYPILEMRDIEHSLCEFDKYCRVKFGEGKPRSQYNGVA